MEWNNVRSYIQEKSTDFKLNTFVCYVIITDKLVNNTTNEWTKYIFFNSKETQDFRNYFDFVESFPIIFQINAIFDQDTWTELDAHW